MTQAILIDSRMRVSGGSDSDFEVSRSHLGVFMPAIYANTRCVGLQEIFTQSGSQK